MFIDLSNMSKTRKIVLTAAGVLYALAVLGNARHGISVVLGVTLFFITITSVIFLWIK